MNVSRLPAPFEDGLRRAHAALRAGRAATAEKWLRELQRQRPDEPNCRWLLGVAMLDLGRPEASLALLEDVVARAPALTQARIDLARALRRSGQPTRARAEIRRVLETFPHDHLAWLAYGDVLVDLGQFDDARIAFERALHTDPHRDRIEAGTAALVADDRKRAEELFRAVLRTDPSHVAALCGLAALSIAADVPQDAERLLNHALKRSAHIPLAWRGMGPALLGLGRLQEAEAAARRLIEMEPRNPQSWVTLAAVHARLLRQEDALEAYEEAARLKPREVRLQMSVGHVHKTLGHRAQSEMAYKSALELDPGLGEAYWSLADLKNYLFADEEIQAMQSLLATPSVGSSEAQLCFALGKALEQRRRFPESFAAYARGNRLRQAQAPFDIEAFERRTVRICATFDAPFLAARRGAGDPSRAPIFIVGLPRSGSTLLEQILASHSQAEGTMELPNILNLVREFELAGAERDGYPESVSATSAERLRALGSRYLQETAPIRRGRAHFTDKCPNNFSHIGLIHCILPHATIIDARRHPMDACFSTFKQHFAEGQTFSYDLETLGRYYRCYLSLMDHWDAVLPGKVLHVQYEHLVQDPEAGIRRLLEHCGLPFEAACLAFHATRRSIRTPSAEQVRQPIYTSGVGQWRAFESELQPLEASLGDALERFANL